MPEQAIPVTYGDPPGGPGTLWSARSRFPFHETLQGLKEAIAAEDLLLIHEIDPQVIMARGGFVTWPIRQLLFFHPRFMVRLLEGDPSALVEVPLKVVILEMPDGRVFVRRPDTQNAFRRYLNLRQLGAELDGICQRLVGTVAIPEPWHNDC
ncbi:DUF302 domain-containing protein [Geothrix sp. 21YS21S-2]|uniref:DUF302 domain-containing protein n=1 Tax=Geothrix sp. 21YS21S-2 TaxID=3068893 RepID=UPI0027BA06C9|nr:DUF302 domain-containing protein [Geothrix sp. 21YS21S-2]